MRNNISQVRNFHYPKKEPTGKQLTQRYLIGLLTARWQTMTDYEKAPFISGALVESERSGKPMTGFNYWIKMAQSNLLVYFGLLAFYPMNETGGYVVNDYSPNLLHFNLFPVAPASTLSFLPSENKKFGNCLVGDGSVKYGYFAPQTKLNWVDQFSFAVDILIGQKDTNDRYFIYSPNHFSIWKRPTDVLTFFVNIGGVDRYLDIPSALLVPNVWNRVCVTYSNNGLRNNFKLYLNSKLYTSKTFTGIGNSSSAYVYLMSQSATIRQAVGAIDNLIFFNRELSLLEIQKQCDLMRVGKERQNLN
ncbi:MAG TPA: hypothetical protein PLQ44_03055 [Candidatus Paceibacterota bacterium]|nr:hypothetical protein [Candidatus Paceibacterota bacterium]